ncbi:MAG: filamentous hemagglutinin N-terminal domain-containing protein [Magnetococcales bacterium]|nr:filamentous hemagglutinin N-terminal domain-containing protein [Magnetococcales bacterium]NGZ26586.1 filamentous hemagglutinin N-terminal domain-containing protein [Magnetococcales bacterium]
MVAWIHYIKLFLSFAWLTLPFISHGEVTLDGSLGSPGSIAGPQYNITPNLGYQSGNNLFFSFSTFNIAANEQAIFRSQSGINHVVSRVTGPGASTINGVLKSEFDNADFWFFNPSGIIIGPQAQLDVRGSLHLSTAHQLRLGTTGMFFADQGQTSVLTSAPPAAFGFLDNPIASITVNGTTSGSPLLIRVPNHKNMDLVGGDILLQDKVILFADSGKIQLLSSGGAGEVEVGGSTPVMNVSHQGRITLNGAEVRVDDLISRQGSGDILIRGGEFIGENQSYVQSVNYGTVTGGVVDIEVNDFILRGGSVIKVSAKESGDAGQLMVQADHLLIRDQDSALLAYTENQGGGGTIRLTVGSLDILEGGYISANSFSGGQGGNIVIHANGDIRLDGYLSSIQAGATGTGNGGSITMESRGLVLDHGGYILASTYGAGAGGHINITAQETILVTGSNSSDASMIQAESRGAGDGGSITLLAKKLSLQEGGQIYAGSTGAGRAGNLAIQLSDALLMNNGTITTRATTADGGNMDIQVKNLIQLQDSQILTLVESGVGDGGNIVIDPVFFVLGNSTISANAFGGNGGNISLVANNLIIDSYSDITASSRLGVSGRVELLSPKVDLSGSLAELPKAFSSEDLLSANRCLSSRAGRSSFSRRGGGGLQERGNGFLWSGYQGRTSTLAALPEIQECPSARFKTSPPPT